MFFSFSSAIYQFSSVQSLSRVWLFATPWTAAHQASFSRWCHPTISSFVVPFSSSLNLSQHQGLFKWVSSLHQVAEVLEFQLQYQPLQWIFRLISFRMDWLHLLDVQGSLRSLPTPQFKSINSLALSFLYSPTLTSIHDHWKNHSLD